MTLRGGDGASSSRSPVDPPLTFPEDLREGAGDSQSYSAGRAGHDRRLAAKFFFAHWCTTLRLFLNALNWQTVVPWSSPPGFRVAPTVLS